MFVVLGVLELALVGRADLKLIELLASASSMWGSKACTTTT